MCLGPSPMGSRTDFLPLGQRNDREIVPLRVLGTRQVPSACAIVAQPGASSTGIGGEQRQAPGADQRHIVRRASRQAQRRAVGA